MTQPHPFYDDLIHILIRTQLSCGSCQANLISIYKRSPWKWGYGYDNQCLYIGLGCLV